MSRTIVLGFLALCLTSSCILAGGGDSAQTVGFTPEPTGIFTPTATPTSIPTPTATPRIIRRSTPTARATPRPRSVAPTLAPPATTARPTQTPVAESQSQARNLVWAHLSRCVSFDPNDLTAVPVRDDWFVKASEGGPQTYGTWKVDSVSGGLEPYDLLAREWQTVVDSECSPEDLSVLVVPTPTLTPQATPTPTPTPRPSPTSTPVLRSTSEAIATLWAYLVKCFPTLDVSDLESTLDPPTGEYIVKDEGSSVYGVWRVGRIDGDISPDNDRARSRNQTVRQDNC